jgi:hypothetical protein
MSMTRVAGIVAACFGALFLLYMFFGSTLQPPGLVGTAWWVSVFRTMVAGGNIVGTADGAICLVCGSLIVMIGVAVLIILGIALS